MGSVENTYLKSRFRTTALPPARVFDIVLADAAGRKSLDTEALFAFTYRSRGCSGGQGRTNCRDKSRNVDRNSNGNGDGGYLCGLRLRCSSTLYRAIEIETTTEGIERWTGVESWGFAAAFVPAGLCNVVCAVAGVWEALNAHHLFALTAWNEGLVGQR